MIAPGIAFGVDVPLIGSLYTTDDLLTVRFVRAV
jgi:hypothetical protein